MTVTKEMAVSANTAAIKKQYAAGRAVALAEYLTTKAEEDAKLAAAAEAYEEALKTTSDYNLLYELKRKPQIAYNLAMTAAEAIYKETLLSLKNERDSQS